MVRERELEMRFSADSAGMGDWHSGEPPDSRASAAASKHGIHLPSICRQIRPADFKDFDLILAMDRSNRDALLAKCPAALRGKVHLMRDFDPATNPDAEPEVPDPYYGDAKGFDRVFDMLHRTCEAMLDKLLKDGDAAGART